MDIFLPSRPRQLPQLPRPQPLKLAAAAVASFWQAAVIPLLFTDSLTFNAPGRQQWQLSCVSLDLDPHLSGVPRQGES